MCASLLKILGREAFAYLAKRYIPKGKLQEFLPGLGALLFGLAGESIDGYVRARMAKSSDRR